ncbi:hypothetical protein [Velocimicrobium porci]|mgnify:CR=1 FL=1|uniref:Bypass of forespore C C-terminal domain-containing protein n=1 Tax=Velocimicrobium porci TaxID=2606634 RepID=A0A6L5XZL7_9FIRM|nr:hypothetical protein [Velocimicrobium porci]MSS64017.1 hypothetical protein [Velocimicrobium porci]
MKRKAGIYIAGTFFSVMLLSLCYYGSYRLSYQHFKQEEKQSEAEKSKAEMVETDTTKIATITPYTQCVLEEYDIETKTVTDKKMSILERFVGYTREELAEYLNVYLEEMPKEEKRNGLIAYDLISFSKDKIVLRKTYDSKQAAYKFFMVAKNSEIVVYYSDKKRVFEYTGLMVDSLPEEELTKLEQGFYVKDKQELYGILENYSS